MLRASGESRCDGRRGRALPSVSGDGDRRWPVGHPQGHSPRCRRTCLTGQWHRPCRRGGRCGALAGSGADGEPSRARTDMGERVGCGVVHAAAPVVTSVSEGLSGGPSRRTGALESRIREQRGTHTAGRRAVGVEPPIELRPVRYSPGLRPAQGPSLRFRCSATRWRRRNAGRIGDSVGSGKGSAENVGATG